MDELKWGKLKEFIEENGITDDDVVDYIDIASSSSGLELYIGADGAFRMLSSSSSLNYAQNDRSEREKEGVMSEAIHCDYCRKSELLSNSMDWWRIEPVRANHIDDEGGGDFCSDRCASNFFMDRLGHVGMTTEGEGRALSDEEIRRMNLGNSREGGTE